MKKIITAAAFLLLVSATYAAQSTTYAAPFPKHSGDRNILSTDLPTALRSDIKKEYAGYWITGLTEEGRERHARYLLTLENPDQIVRLRAGKGASWEVISTSLKASS